MKKLLLLLMIIASHSVFSQNIKSDASLLDAGPSFPGCPSGYCPVGNISLDVLNFHKPRTSCTSGFGFCIKLSIMISCEPCGFKTYVKDNKVFAYAKIANNVAEIHIPTSLKYQKGFENADMATFEIEDKTISLKTASGIVKWLKSGIYPVVVLQDEYILSVPII
jgi:hypothetical protein